MLKYIEYLNVPTRVAFSLVGTFLIMQVIGEVLEFKGKVVPEALKARKYFDRKKKERDIINQVPIMFKDVQDSLSEFQKHYSPEKLEKRDRWIENVNKRLEDNDAYIKELDKKLDKNNQDTLSLLIDNKRNTIIAFASRVIDDKSPVTREEFNRIIKMYDEYEKIIEANNLTNGEVDIAIRIIRESYENHMKNRTFVEDIRGYIG